jgi:hypothetical protein
MGRKSTPPMAEMDWIPPGATSLVGAATAQPKPPAPAPSLAASQPAPVTYPSKDRLGRPIPTETFYCQYLGLAKDASGKYPLYQNDWITMAISPAAIQNGWKLYIETTYHPTSPGSPSCSIVPDDPVQRDGALKAVNKLTQPATQVVVKTSWKP